MSSGIARAIEELQLERQNLTVRIEKLDALMAQMREMFHLPGTNGRKPRRTAPDLQVGPTEPPTGSDHPHRPDLDEAIRMALRKGPMGPGELAAALQVERVKLRVRIKALEARGILVSTGTTASRRVALAHYEAAAAAKEAP